MLIEDQIIKTRNIDPFISLQNLFQSGNLDQYFLEFFLSLPTKSEYLLQYHHSLYQVKIRYSLFFAEYVIHRILTQIKIHLKASSTSCRFYLRLWT